MKIVGKRDPKLRLRIKVDPGRSGMLEQLGTTLTNEVTTAVNALTGHPLDRLRISFTKRESAQAAKGAGAASVQSYQPQQPQQPARAPHPARVLTAEEMADEAVAGSEGASLNTAAAMAR